MRIWDLHPGYLDRQRLLGEHRELHGLAVVHLEGRRGYAAHPETKRWKDCLGALAVRHGWLVAEMTLRGYRHRSPLPIPPDPSAWPGFLDAPGAQVALLRAKYAGATTGRIPLPEHPQHAWAQHKYSVLARDPNAYREWGRRMSQARREDLPAVMDDLTLLLRQPPTPGGVRNAVEHMWGHVRRHAAPEEVQRAKGSLSAMLRLTQQLAQRHAEAYLLHSTALSEMAFWLACYGMAAEEGARADA